MKTFKLKKKTSYGKERNYFINEEDRKQWEHLTGKKTVTKEDIKALKKLGFQIKVEFENQKL